MDKQTVKQDASWIGARLREPSTYVGLGAVLVGFFHLDAATAAVDASTLSYGGLFLGGLLGMVLPEGKN